MADLFERSYIFSQFVYSAIWSNVTMATGRLWAPPSFREEDLTGKLAIITGANTGIGLSIATSLARANATVYLACRDVQKGQNAAAQIIDSLAPGSGSSKRVHVVQLDTSSLKSVRAFADAWDEAGRDSASSARTIDILVHNAGIAGAPPGKDVTADDLGTMYATNHAGPFLLTSLLEKFLALDARVILTNSAANFNGNLLNTVTIPRYVPQLGVRQGSSSIYADTKSMQIAFAQLLQERWRKQAETNHNTRVAHSFSPGYTNTQMISRIQEIEGFDPLWFLLKAGASLATPVDTGAATGYWLASTSDKAVTDPANGGRYWDRLQPWATSADVYAAKYGRGFFTRLWDLWSVDTGAQWA